MWEIGTLRTHYLLLTTCYLLLTTRYSLQALTLQREINALRPGGRLVVFCLAKRQCDAICRALAGRLRCAVLHSERRPAERARALEDFASGEVPLLVATGADALSGHVSLAEGTSLVGLAEVVLYYDFPRQMDEYARRTRDLSRRGFCGVAVSFLTSHDLRPLTPGFTQQVRTTYLLFATCYSLLTTYCLLLTAHDSRLTTHHLPLTTYRLLQARDDVERGMLALCVKGSPRTSVLLGKRDRLLAHRQMLGLLKERPVILALTGQRSGGVMLEKPLFTLCTSNLSLVPVERWASLP